jgi:hypothetical protein
LFDDEGEVLIDEMDQLTDKLDDESIKLSWGSKLDGIRTFSIIFHYFLLKI